MMRVGMSHLGGFIQAGADLQFLGALVIAFDELAVYAFLHDDAAGGSAPMAGGAEASPDSAFDGEVEIGVVEHDHGIFAAEFERAMFETFRGGLSHDAANRGRTGE